MSTLTGQQINNTYQGLLKLSTSSSGITSSLQSIEDGLGGNTGIRIATNQLESPNVQGYIRLKAQYYGPGLTATAGAQYAAGTQNTIIAVPFYDSGLYSYSAITVNCLTGTSSTDTVSAAIYTSQMINPYGLYPHAPIISGITLPVTVGFTNVSFGSNISMSGYGAGVYWLVYKISNAGVQPTVRYGTIPAAYSILNMSSSIYGIASGSTVNVWNSYSYRLNGNNMNLSSQTTFDNPFGDMSTKQSTAATVAGGNIGFLLHTV